MSTLNVQTIQSNSSGFNNVVTFAQSEGVENGTLCRVWVRFNGTGSITINDSFNVASITDAGDGEYTINLTNAMADTNYVILATTGIETNRFNDLISKKINQSKWEEIFKSN